MLSLDPEEEVLVESERVSVELVRSEDPDPLLELLDGGTLGLQALNPFSLEEEEVLLLVGGVIRNGSSWVDSSLVDS